MQLINLIVINIEHCKLIFFQFYSNIHQHIISGLRQLILTSRHDFFRICFNHLNPVHLINNMLDKLYKKIFFFYNL